jgi:hypothetical protein
MQFNVYGIFDTASGIYDRPFVMQSDGQALRAFGDIAVDAEHPIGKHPEDFSLFRLGTFNDNTGELTCTGKECLATALEMVAASRKVDGRQLKIFDEAVGEN